MMAYFATRSKVKRVCILRTSMTRCLSTRACIPRESQMKFQRPALVGESFHPVDGYWLTRRIMFEEADRRPKAWRPLFTFELRRPRLIWAGWPARVPRQR